MNALKMGPAAHAVSGLECSSRCSVDREAQDPRAALVIARDAREEPARSAETSPRSQAHANPKPFRVAIKVEGKILFINLCDVVSVQAKGKCVWAPREREFLSAASVYFCRGGGARNLRIHSHSPICAREHLVGRRNQAAFDGRILPASRGRKGIYRHPYLQEESQLPCRFLDRDGRVLPRLAIHLLIKSDRGFEFGLKNLSCDASKTFSATNMDGGRASERVSRDLCLLRFKNLP
jgi:hypothetical protein